MQILNLTSLNHVLAPRWGRSLFCLAMSLFGWSALYSSAPAQVLTARDLFGEIADLGAAHQDLDQAVKSFGEGKVAEARMKLGESYKAHPELPPGDTMLAQMLFAKQQFAAGLNSLESSVKDVPEDPEAYIFMGEYCLSQKLITSAEALAKQATEQVKKYQKNPKRKIALQLRILNIFAAVLESRESWKDAAGYLQSWVNMASDAKTTYKASDAVFASVLSRLGKSLYLSGKADDAKKAFTQAKAKAATSALPELAIAVLAGQKKDPQVADLYAAAGKAGENDLQTQLTLSQYYLDQGDIDTAKRHADKAGTLDPKSLDARILRGVVARVRGDATAAEALFKEAHMMNPADFTASNQLALVLIEQAAPELHQRAVALAEINMKVFSNSPDAAATLAWIYHRVGNNQRALEMFNTARSLGALTSDGNFYVAKMLSNDGQTDEAKRYLANALRMKVTYPLRKEAQLLADKLGVSADGTAEPSTEPAASPPAGAGS